MLLDAKIIELTESFQAKLGWMVGIIYSRVGTQDYKPDEQELSDKLIKYISWIPQGIFSEFKRIARQDSEVSSNIENYIKRLVESAKQEIENKKKERLNTLADKLGKLLELTDVSSKEKIICALNSIAIAKYLKLD